MRKVLLRFVFDQFWTFQSVGNELLVGAGWLVAVMLIVTVVLVFVNWRIKRDLKAAVSENLSWLVLPAFILAVPILNLSLVNSGIPVFGYGFMMFVGFSTATLLAARRIQTVGLPPDIIWDLMMWLLIPGLIGARAVYLSQYGPQVFAGKTGLALLIAPFALWDGGIVFYGCIIGGVIGLLVYCRERNVDPLVLCDVIAPSLFVGEGFGRIGCFLYGCCFGAPCALPWSVQFPPDSITFQRLVERGTILPDAISTIPLHPTQIYSSVSAFLLAGLLAWFFRRRPFDGAVLAMAWIIYPINRYVLEIYRDDEPGRLGLTLTFSQLMSIGLLVSGIAAMYYFHKRNKLTRAADSDCKADANA
ncbi:MAG: prolipoprotein diacylglyceryl transferase [Planctomycetaceae bacterium]|nr:prolipoprotein diacylglyceryl transferase [Planctomycetaceae bacterium]